MAQYMESILDCQLNIAKNHLTIILNSSISNIPVYSLAPKKREEDPGLGNLFRGNSEKVAIQDGEIGQFSYPE